MSLIPASIQAAVAALEPREERARVEKQLRPDGRYNATVTDVTPGVSANGNSKLTFTLKFDETAPEHWDTIKYTLTLTEAGAWKAQQVFDALGVPLTVSSTDELLGKRAELVLGVRSYVKQDGTPGEANEVKYFNSLNTKVAATKTADLF